MGRALTASEFIAYAAEQIRADQIMLAQHQLVETGICSCGRIAACPIATQLRASIAHFRGKRAQCEQAALAKGVAARKVSVGQADLAARWRRLEFFVGTSNY